jgi:GTP diphosphokinase / guanosine-3',5'-bis(diphosphate) 3'-diphosphatase
VLDYARCCRPVPGDDIRGHVSVGRGIVVHRMECRSIKARPQDWVPLAWSDIVQGDYLAELRVKAENRRGLLARVTTEIAEAESSIENVQMPDRAGGDAIEMRFIVTVKSRVHLARVLRRVRQVEGVEAVRRS